MPHNFIYLGIDTIICQCKYSRRIWYHKAHDDSTFPFHFIIVYINCMLVCLNARIGLQDQLSPVRQANFADESTLHESTMFTVSSISWIMRGDHWVCYSKNNMMSMNLTCIVSRTVVTKKICRNDLTFPSYMRYVRSRHQYSPEWSLCSSASRNDN